MKNLLLIFTLSLLPLNAKALPWYYEFGGGYAVSPSMTQIFPNAINPIAKFGLQLNFGVQLQNNLAKPILFQLGVANRYIGYDDGDISGHRTFGVYPFIRVEFWKFGFSAGITPLFYSATPTDTQTFKMSPVSGMLSILYEGYILFPITKEIDFGINGTYFEHTLNSKTLDPTLQYGVFFRINTGGTTEQREQRRNSKGWRYPFGKTKK